MHCLHVGGHVLLLGKLLLADIADQTGGALGLPLLLGLDGGLGLYYRDRSGV